MVVVAAPTLLSRLRTMAGVTPVVTRVLRLVDGLLAVVTLLSLRRPLETGLTSLLLLPPRGKISHFGVSAWI